MFISLLEKVSYFTFKNEFTIIIHLEIILKNWPSIYLAIISNYYSAFLHKLANYKLMVSYSQLHAEAKSLKNRAACFLPVRVPFIFFVHITILL